jgi:hypothetical protein
MMAAPFVAFVVSMGLAVRGRERAALAALVIALLLSAAMFAWHATDTLDISL